MGILPTENNVASAAKNSLQQTLNRVVHRRNQRTMKCYKTISLVVVALGCSALPSTAGNGYAGTGRASFSASTGGFAVGNSVPGVVTVGRGATGSGVAVTIPGYGNGNPYLVAASANFAGDCRGFSNFGGTVGSIPGVTTVGRGVTGSGVAVTIPGYGSGYPALVAANADFAGDSSAGFPNSGGTRGGRNWGGKGNSSNNGNVIVVSPDNGYNWNYNNANYLGLPPWYRLNYYTPSLDDYENGTAYQNIPSSHAWRGYGIPDGVPGTTTYGMPSSQTNAQASAQQPAVNVDFVVGVQRELRRRGFYRGIVNGISDASTRSAIRAFEASAGLPVTGVIGVPLLQALGFF